MSKTHLAGNVVTIGDLKIQRCLICGERLAVTTTGMPVDLSVVWEKGAWVSWLHDSVTIEKNDVLEFTDESDLPKDCCFHAIKNPVEKSSGNQDRKTRSSKEQLFWAVKEGRERIVAVFANSFALSHAGDNALPQIYKKLSEMGFPTKRDGLNKLISANSTIVFTSNNQMRHEITGYHDVQIIMF